MGGSGVDLALNVATGGAYGVNKAVKENTVDKIKEEVVDKPMKLQRDAADASIAAQNKLVDAQQKRTADQESTAAANATRDQARARQRQQAQGAQGRSSTILTSPLGVVGGSSGATKTLLGV